MSENKSILIPKYVSSRVMKVFQVYADPISDILGDTSCKEYEQHMQFLELDLPFEPEIWDFFKKNEESFAFLAKRQLEVQKLGGDTKKIFFLKNNQYKKYINGLRKRKIGMVKDGSIFDPLERSYWERQELFKDIIEEHIIKTYETRNGYYHYTTVADVFDLFYGNTKSQSISGTELYKNFLNENGRYDFNLSPESIGSYLKSITRYFRKHRVHFEGHRLNIYSLVNH